MSDRNPRDRKPPFRPSGGKPFGKGRPAGGRSAEAAGVAARCQAAGGDFFAEVSRGHAYIMKNIIHDWSDEKALSILRNCHRAGTGKTKVILVEAVVTPGNDPHFAKWLDLEMMLLPGGRERTEAEFVNLLEQAGFRLARVVQTKSPVCVLEAEKLNGR